ncbi:hypothetical protein E4U32_007392 [Claviceps aff. humidiphila group G2b]|nr:hypothetical protein E4U32_007392 [Claviceps aff. humidiphila group G2b]
MSHFISSFRLVPIQLLRVNAGKKIRLREYAASKGKSFDVVSENGLIKPKALDPPSYTGMSSTRRYHAKSDLSEIFREINVVVYAVDEGMTIVVLQAYMPLTCPKPLGTKLPDDLILVNEEGAHYSLQPAVEMSLIHTFGCYDFRFPLDAETDDELPLPQFLTTFPNLRTLKITDLNNKIADFLEGHATLYTKKLERMACEIRPILSALIISQSLAEAARIRETVQAYLSLGGFDAMTVIISNFVTSGGRWENFEGHTLYSYIFISAKL